MQSASSSGAFHISARKPSGLHKQCNYSVMNAYNNVSSSPKPLKLREGILCDISARKPLQAAQQCD